MASNSQLEREEEAVGRPGDDDGPGAGGVAAWARRRNTLGILNWELAVITVVAAVAGVVATIGSSLLGVG